MDFCVGLQRSSDLFIGKLEVIVDFNQILVSVIPIAEALVQNLQGALAMLNRLFVQPEMKIPLAKCTQLFWRHSPYDILSHVICGNSLSNRHHRGNYSSHLDSVTSVLSLGQNQTLFH
jgi:hypothetical protein